MGALGHSTYFPLVNLLRVLAYLRLEQIFHLLFIQVAIRTVHLLLGLMMFDLIFVHGLELDRVRIYLPVLLGIHVVLRYVL